MAVLLTGAGGLFTRLGHLGGIVNDINFARGGTITATDYAVTIPSKIVTVQTDYANGTQRKDLVDGINSSLASWQSSTGSILSALQQIAIQTVVQMVHDDQVQPDLNLSTAMATLIQQMTTATAKLTTASSLSLGAQTAIGTPNGTPIFVMSTVDGGGYGLDYAFSDLFTFLVNSDNQSGGATLAQEPYSVKGQVSVADPLGYLWPAGSGGSGSGTLVDATLNNSGGNVAYNGSFETWSNTNYPDNWVIATGAATTNVTRGSTAFDGTYSLAITGDVGTTKTALTQQFNHAVSTTSGAGGSPYIPLPATLYAVNLWYANAIASPAAGTLEIAFVNSVGTIIKNNAGVDQTATVDLSAVADALWHPLHAVFSLPSLLPAAGVFLRVGTPNTAMTNTKIVYIDRLAVAPMVSLYKGGPSFAGFSSATTVLLNDSWTMALTNTMGGFQRLFERFFGMKSLGLRLPTAGGGASIADTLIT